MQLINVARRDKSNSEAEFQSGYASALNEMKVYFPFNKTHAADCFFFLSFFQALPGGDKGHKKTFQQGDSVLQLNIS